MEYDLKYYIIVKLTIIFCRRTSKLTQNTVANVIKTTRADKLQHPAMIAFYFNYFYRFKLLKLLWFQSGLEAVNFLFIVIDQFSGDVAVCWFPVS